MSAQFPDSFDVVVVGAGHAGCEAALAAARLGAKCLLATINLEHIAALSCNPAVGGLAKGHLVKEIDALGGEMGLNTDATGIQFRLLNQGKGPAVWSSRAQVDMDRYPARMAKVCADQPNPVAAGRRGAGPGGGVAAGWRASGWAGEGRSRPRR